MSIFLNKRHDGSLALFIDGDLQFDERDEKIYHQALVLPALHLAISRLPQKNDIKALIVGGGDGLAARELLYSERIGGLDLVDYSPEVLALAVKDLARVNCMSLTDRRINVHVMDAWQFAHDSLARQAQYDLIVVDLTVARDVGGAKFHSVDWYALLAKMLSENGILAANCLSPSNTPQAYWSIFNSMQTAHLAPVPYRVNVPSFRQLGYGQDWGFMLASKEAVNEKEFDNWPAFQSTVKVETSQVDIFGAEYLRNLFIFPAGFDEMQPLAHPAEAGSNLLIRYQNSALPLTSEQKGCWNALRADLSSLITPTADKNKRILSSEMRLRLADKTAAIFPRGEEQLFADVFALMPALQPSHTRSMIAEFLCDPASFLEAIDVRGLVNILAERAGELPAAIAHEIVLLQEKLIDWAGDWEILLGLGRRMVTALAIVVILANFVFPDSAYGKGGFHGGGGHFGHGGQFGSRGGSWNHHWGNNRGYYGGWGRPNHWNRFGYGYGYGGWGGGYGYGYPYYYASGPGYQGNYYNSDQYPDSQGNQYPVAQYSIQTYGTVPDQPWIPPAGSTVTTDKTDTPMASDSDDVNANVLKAAYRLGPDVDILTNGSTVVPLADDAYLKVNAQAADLIDQQNGQLLIALASDPALTWHLASEIKEQAKGLKKAAQAKDVAGGSADQDNDAVLPQEVMQLPSTAPDATSSSQRQPDAARDEAEAANLTTTAKLLDKAQQILGNAPEKQPETTEPPVPGAFELFNSAWADQNGKFVILKKADGKLVYLDGKNWYSDMGTTKLETPYPPRLKAVIGAYLTSLSQDTSATRDSLNQEQQDMQNHLNKMKEHLATLKQGNSQDNSQSNSQNSAQISATTDGQDLVKFGTREMPRAEAIKRMEGLVERAQKRLDAVQNEINNLPAETQAVKKLLSTFHS